MEASVLTARASAGDHDAFRALVEVRSRTMGAHHWRILVSLGDNAETAP
jgi:hypothetical protein